MSGIENLRSSLIEHPRFPEHEYMTVLFDAVQVATINCCGCIPDSVAHVVIGAKDGLGTPVETKELYKVDDENPYLAAMFHCCYWPVGTRKTL